MVDGSSEVSGFGDEGRHVLDEQRIAARRLDDLRARMRLDALLVDERLDEGLGLVRGKRLEEHGGRIRLPAAPARPCFEQLEPRETEEQQRRAACVGEPVDDVEERVARPVHIVEHDDECLLSPQCGEQPPQRP